MSSILLKLKQLGLFKISVFVLLLVFYGSFITYKITLPGAEDLPRQIMNGQDILRGDFDVLYKNVYSYTNPGHSFANHHWLYGVFVYCINSIVGFDGIVIFKIILLLFSFGLLFYTALRRANFWLVALFSIPTILILMGRGSARPEMFSYLFTVIFIYFLSSLEENPKSKKVFWLIPIQLLWANIHILFPAGVAIVGAFWLSATIKNWKGAVKNLLVRKLTLVLFFVSAISFANPFGINGVIYSLKANTVGAARVFSAEVQSIADVFKVEPRSEYIGAAIFVPMLIVLGLSFIVGRKKKNISYLVMSIAFALLSFKIIRGLPIFALVFLPAVTSNLDGLYNRISGYIRVHWSQIWGLLKVVVPVFFIVFLIFGTLVWRHRLHPYQIFGVGITETSNDPVKFFKDNGLKGPILNDTDIGSYLIYHLYPEEKVFADNRFGDAYTKEFLENEYQQLFEDDSVWRDMLNKYKFNTIILNHYNRGGSVPEFIYSRVYDPQWVWVYAGRDAVIFVRNVPENEAVIRKYAITQDNVQERLSYLSQAPDYHGQVAAADLFAYVGNPRLAIPIYEKIVSRWPYMGRIWFVIGRNELLRSDQANADSAFALLAIQHAIDAGYKTPYSYSYLALAYYRLGDMENAQKAVKKELAIDPNIQDGKEWEQIFIRDKLKKLSDE